MGIPSMPRLVRSTAGDESRALVSSTGDAFITGVRVGMTHAYQRVQNSPQTQSKDS